MIAKATSLRSGPRGNEHLRLRQDAVRGKVTSGRSWILPVGGLLAIALAVSSCSPVRRPAATKSSTAALPPPHPTISLPSPGSVETATDERIPLQVTASTPPGSGLPPGVYVLALVEVNSLLSISSLVAVDMDGNPFGSILPAGPIGSAVLSPDGEQFAVTSSGLHGSLLVIDSQDGHPRAGLPVDDTIGWAPDSNRMAVGIGDDIFIFDSIHSSVQLLVDCDVLLERAVCSDPAWSPDGTMIAFTLTNPAPRPGPPEEGLYVTDVACLGSGADCAAMTRGPFAIQESPSWSPDSKVVAGFSRDQDIVFLNAPDFAPPRVVEIPEGTFPRHLAWSPHGDSLAYTQDCKIRLLDADSGASRDLYSAGLACVEGPLSWLVVPE